MFKLVKVPMVFPIACSRRASAKAFARASPKWLPLTSIDLSSYMRGRIWCTKHFHGSSFMLDNKPLAFSLLRVSTDRDDKPSCLSAARRLSAVALLACACSASLYWLVMYGSLTNSRIFARDIGDW